MPDTNIIAKIENTIVEAKIEETTFEVDISTTTAHTIASHSDTTATGAELEELTDGSETSLHSHSGTGIHAATHQNGGADEVNVAGLSGLLADDQHVLDSEVITAAKTIKLDDFAAPDDNTDLNATTTEHGLLKKLDNDSTHYMDGQGNWTTPTGGTITTIKEGGVQVGDADIVTLDLDGDDFNTSESPDTEVNITINDAGIDHNLTTNTHNLTTDIDHDQLTNYVLNEHINHTSVTLTAGVGLTGGGDISANRTFDVDVGIADDKIVQIDHAAVADNDYAKFTVNGLEGRSYAEVADDIESSIDHANLDNKTIVSHDTTATGAELDTLTNGSDADALHTHPTNATDADLTAHEADTTNIHGITDTSDLALKSGNVNQLADITSAGADIEDAVTKKHDESHTIASHSDTTATGAELETLTDGSDADSLHSHAVNDAHVAGDGSDHADVASNTTHRSSDGTDHSDVVLNNTHRQDNSQAHSDYLINNGADSTSGLLTAAGFTLSSGSFTGQNAETITNTTNGRWDIAGDIYLPSDVVAVGGVSPSDYGLIVANNSSSPFTDAANDCKGINSYVVRDPASSTTKDTVGIGGYSIAKGSNFGAGSKLIGLDFIVGAVTPNAGGSNSLTSTGIRVYGGYSLLTTFTALNVYGIDVTAAFSAFGSTTATSAWGIKINDSSKGGGNITNLYGMEIDKPTVGGSNYQLVLDGTGAGSGMWVGGTGGHRLYSDGTDIYLTGMQDASGNHPVEYTTATGKLTYDSSSARYKMNIRPYNTDFTALLHLKPKQYERKSSGVTEIGYIAEDLEELGLTDIVGYNEEGLPDYIKRSPFMLYLLENIKLLNKRLTNLEQSQ